MAHGVYILALSKNSEMMNHQFILKAFFAIYRLEQNCRLISYSQRERIILKECIVAQNFCSNNISLYQPKYSNIVR